MPRPTPLRLHLLCQALGRWPRARRGRARPAGKGKRDEGTGQKGGGRGSPGSRGGGAPLTSGPAPRRQRRSEGDPRLGCGPGNEEAGAGASQCRAEAPGRGSSRWRLPLAALPRAGSRAAPSPEGPRGQKRRGSPGSFRLSGRGSAGLPSRGREAALPPPGRRAGAGDRGVRRQRSPAVEPLSLPA